MAYDEITEALLASEDTEKVLEMLSRHACAIFDATHASVIVPHEGGSGMRVAAAHGQGSESMVGRDIPPGGLPEVVMRSAEPLLLEDVTAVTRDHGLRALGLGPAMIAPVGAEDAVFGVLFIGARPSRHPYQPADLADAAHYAARTGVVMVAGQTRKAVEIDLRQTTAQLQEALNSRVVIEQAKGFLSCLRHVAPDKAFTLLRQYARSHNTDIHLVARQVLERRLFV